MTASGRHSGSGLHAVHNEWIDDLQAQLEAEEKYRQAAMRDLQADFKRLQAATHTLHGRFISLQARVVALHDHLQNVLDRRQSDCWRGPDE